MLLYPRLALRSIRLRRLHQFGEGNRTVKGIVADPGQDNKKERVQEGRGVPPAHK